MMTYDSSFPSLPPFRGIFGQGFTMGNPGVGRVGHRGGSAGVAVQFHREADAYAVLLDGGAGGFGGLE